ncbi:MAG: hypothetical protein ACPH6A_07690, partial [Flavobacteriaceae bacterium]
SEIGKSKSKEALTLFLNQHLEEVNEQLAGYKKISTIIVVNDEWTVENGLTTPTLKIKRNQVDKKYENNYEAWHKDTATVLYES